MSTCGEDLVNPGHTQARPARGFGYEAVISGDTEEALTLKDEVKVVCGYFMLEAEFHLHLDLAAILKSYRA